MQTATRTRRPKVGIIFTVLNNFKGAVEAIESIRSEHEIDLIIIDQWRNNRTLAHAWNIGAQRAFERGCDYAIVCNDDILFAPESIDAMVAEYQRLQHSEKVVMVTPNNITAELLDPYDILNYKRPDDPPTFSDHPNFSCFLIGREFFDLVGSFDENFKPAWYEDNDMHRRIELLGYRAICTTAAPQVHFGGVSTSMLENPNSGDSKRYYIKKWGGVPVSHPTAEEKEHFTTPYNDPNLSPKEWEVQSE